MAESTISGHRMADDPVAAAFELMRRALKLIDQAQAQDAGAQLDLVIRRLDRLNKAVPTLRNYNIFLVRFDKDTAEPRFG